MSNKRNNAAFTIVELLVVIVVIAILAAITVVAYNGIQQRARDTARQSDFQTLRKALEFYYIDNGQYPVSSGSTVISNGWSTTNDASWQNLVSQLVPKYISSLPTDPANTNSASSVGNNKNYGYAYYSNSAVYFCNAPTRHMYILTMKLEGASQTQTTEGDCISGVDGPGPYTYNTTYRSIRN